MHNNIDFVNMMSAFLNKKSFVNKTVNWDEIIDCAKKNNLLGALYVVLKDSDITVPEEIQAQLKNQFLAICKYSIEIEYTLELIIKIFNANNIPFVILKGGWIRDLYPVKEVRTMGDIDILIKNDSINIADKLLKDSGFKKDEQYSLAEVYDYKRGNVLLELHTSIVSENLLNEVDYIEYFKNPFEHTYLLEGCRYELDLEYNLIYMLLHMAKHFSTTGCGIRMYMDIAVYLKRYNNELNWDSVYIELKKLKLNKFADITFALCKKWFGSDIYGEITDIDKDYYMRLEEYIVGGGVFGADNGLEGANNLLRNNYVPNKNVAFNFLNKIKSFFCWLFPSDEFMRFRYPWYVNKPKWFLPMAWFKRFIVTFKEKGSYVFKNAKGTIDSSNNVDEQYDFLKKSGLL